MMAVQVAVSVIEIFEKQISGNRLSLRSLMEDIYLQQGWQVVGMAPVGRGGKRRRQYLVTLRAGLYVGESQT